MIRIAASLVVAATAAAAINVSPASPQGTDVDLRCTSTDQLLSERLRDMLPEQAEASLREINLVMARMASARFDCKRGRVERGLSIYAKAEATLRDIEERTAAKLMPTLETASGDVTAR